MLNVFGALRGVAQVRTGAGVVHVSSAWSALHHRLTAPLLLFLMLLVSARQYLGEPVQCIQQKTGDDAPVPERVMNNYCFISTTYTVVRPRLGSETSARARSTEHRRVQWRRRVVPGASGSSMPIHPGLVGLQGLGDDPWHEDDDVDPEKVRGQHGATIRRHAYYQWVPLVLMLQALMFFAPYAAWTQWEGGLVSSALLALGLSGPESDIMAADVRQRRVRTLARYFYGTLNNHVVWAAGYWGAEFLNLVNVVGNVLLTDALLGGRFFSYGVNVMALLSSPSLEQLERDRPMHPQVRVDDPDPYPDHPHASPLLPGLGPRPGDPNAHPEDPADPMEAVFPKLTKCTFFKYGPSGSIQRHDALCVMALNVVNEKVFVLLWFWFAFLAVTSLLVVVRSTLALMACVCVRLRPTRSRLTLWLLKVLLGVPRLGLSQGRVRERGGGRGGVRDVADVAGAGPLCANLDCGDWLFLMLLGSNMQPSAFRALVQDIVLLLGSGSGAGPGSGGLAVKEDLRDPYALRAGAPPEPTEHDHLVDEDEDEENEKESYKDREKEDGGKDNDKDKENKDNDKEKENKENDKEKEPEKEHEKEQVKEIEKESVRENERERDVGINISETEKS